MGLHQDKKCSNSIASTRHLYLGTIFSILGWFLVIPFTMIKDQKICWSIASSCWSHLVTFQTGHSTSRLLAFVDKNRDLFLTRIRFRPMTSSAASGVANQPLSAKLGSMVQSMQWNTECNMLATIRVGSIQLNSSPFLFTRSNTIKMDLSLNCKVTSFWILDSKNNQASMLVSCVARVSIIHTSLTSLKVT